MTSGEEEEAGWTSHIEDVSCLSSSSWVLTSSEEEDEMGPGACDDGEVFLLCFEGGPLFEEGDFLVTVGGKELGFLISGEG